MKSRPVARWIVAILVFGLAIAVVSIVVGLVLLPARRSDLGFEVVKAGLQLGVVTVIGAVVAMLLRLLESRRDDERRRHEYRLTVFRELVAAYNGVKAVRRTLRAYGFLSRTSGRLSVEQVAAFDAQMRSLVANQLTFESVGRELEIRDNLPQKDGALFQDAETAGRFRQAVATIEEYLHTIIKEWEQTGGMISVGTDVTKTPRLEKLRRFIAGKEPASEPRAAESTGFKEGAKEPMERLQQEMLRNL